MKPKLKLRKLSLPVLACMILGLAVNTGVNRKAIRADAYDIVEPSAYYAGLKTSTSGTSFRKEVYDLMMVSHKTYTSYLGTSETSLSKVFPKTDGKPGDSGQVELFYTGEYRNFDGSFQGSINREHVWPDSRGVSTTGPGADAHHIRPCDVTVNGQRGNLGYGPGGYIPTDEYKGVAARIIFYIGAHYGPDSSYGLTIDENVNSGKSTTFGSLKTLLEWNLKYPVNASEQRRNVAVQAIQGNRNPFIDHPEYACRIWGETSSETRNICTIPVETDAEVDNVISLIDNIGTVNLNSLSRIVLAEDAYAELSSTQKAKVTNYSTLTDARTTYNQLSSIDPDVANVMDLIAAIGNVTKDSESHIIAAETAYADLSPALQSEVTNYTLLINARLAFEKLLNPTNEGSFTLNMYDAAFLGVSDKGVNATLSYMQSKVDEENGASYISGFSIDDSTRVRHSMNGGLTLGISMATGKFTLTLSSEIASKLTKVEVYGALYDGTNVNNLTLNGATAVQGSLSPVGTTLLNVTNPLIWNFIEGPASLTFASVSNRSTIYKIVFSFASDNVDYEVMNVMYLIDQLGDITLSDGEDIDSVEYYYELLTDEQKTKVTNYDVLLEAKENLAKLIEANDTASDIVNIIASLGIIDLDSGPDIIFAENAYNALTELQKTFVFNYSSLQTARQTFDNLKANIVKDLINAIGIVTKDSKEAIQAARSAFDSLENSNQIKLVTNINTLTNAEITYQRLLNDLQQFDLATNAMTWNSTTYATGAHRLTSDTQSWIMSSGQLNGGISYMGTNEYNSEYMNFTDENGFKGLESFITDKQNFYTGIKMDNFAISKPVSITFNWIGTNSAFTMAIIASTDNGNTWTKITADKSVNSGISTAGSLSWVTQVSNAKRLSSEHQNLTDAPHVQFALIAGTNSSFAGTIRNLTAEIVTAGRYVDITNACDILVSEIECANTCEDYDLAPQYSASYGNLTSIEKQEFDQIIGMDGVNVKTKLDYMLTLYQQNTPQPAANPLAIIGQSDEMLIFLALVLLSLSGFAVYTFRKKKQYN